MISRRNLLAMLAVNPCLQAQTSKRVKSLKITVLTTMLTDRAGIGEWGFAAMVDVDGRRILFDTGGRPDTLVTNAKELGIDFSGVRDVRKSRRFVSTASCPHGNCGSRCATAAGQAAKCR